MGEVQDLPIQTTEKSDGILAINAVDSSHAYYIHPSDHPDMNLVSTIFDGRSYGGWRRVVMIALSAKNKLGFIDGSLVVPTNTNLQTVYARYFKFTKTKRYQKGAVINNVFGTGPFTEEPSGAW
ncbi:uncharacterized protein LOC107838794 isoform X2 [Capsicum annuum]|uniref:uncharacterized protein LOC107838794 isoform X2 n=1 Tax=Capsicum annuum TaxID=4072 RepID=UPI0007BEBB82|nr:uncharacterized protein LOC107838794 isoform X2 [Capsicum annuum]